MSSTLYGYMSSTLHDYMSSTTSPWLHVLDAPRLHVLDAPLVRLLGHGLAIGAILEQFLLEAVRSIDAVPAVARPNAEPAETSE